MTPDQIIKLASEGGMGVLSFLALGYIGYKILQFVDKIGETATKFMENHMQHLQDGMEKLVENSNEANQTLRDHGKSLDAQSQMLGIIVDQTKK